VLLIVEPLILQPKIVRKTDVAEKGLREESEVSL
jgi:hypothetical protein